MGALLHGPLHGPWASLWPICGGLIAATWLLSVLTREYSWVDRLWSIVPSMYLWVLDARLGFAVPRLTLVAALVTVWGARLTFNFARKGGYAKGGEDYRWGVLRRRLGPWKFQLFNATFISPYQNLILLFLTAPAATIALSATPLGPVDLALAAVFLALLMGETVADQQQWRFYQGKAARQARGEGGPDFCSTGLFRYSRHPNFVCEIGQWWVVYLFAVAASGAWLQWTSVGAVLLTLLFDGSTRFTEAISGGKYPAYVEYQRVTSRLLPWFPRAGRGPAVPAAESDP